MEASEKRQISLENATGGTVRVINDRLVIEDLTVTDQRVAQVVRERVESGRGAPETVTKAIEIGARVLQSEGAAANVDYVKAEVERLHGSLGDALGKTLESGSEELASQLASIFGAESSSSVQHQIREMVSQANEQQRVALTHLFSAEDGANPLTDFKSAVVAKVNDATLRNERQAEKLRESHEAESKAMRTKVAELETMIARLLEQREGDERVSEAEAAGTRKGFTFEERVNDAIDSIASARGDACTHTGGELADGGGKKGDTMVELGAAHGPANGRIIFESKDKKLSKADAWRELNSAMSARAASFGVLVVAGEDRVPSGREQLTEYEGNKLIVAVDREEPHGLTLEVAYRLAAARVLMSHDGELEVDAAAVRNAASEAITCLKQAQSIRSTLTGIKTSSDRARQTLDEMVASAEGKLQLIDSLIEQAEPDEDV